MAFRLDRLEAPAVAILAKTELLSGLRQPRLDVVVEILDATELLIRPDARRKIAQPCAVCQTMRRNHLQRQMGVRRQRLAPQIFHVVPECRIGLLTAPREKADPA